MLGTFQKAYKIQKSSGSDHIQTNLTKFNLNSENKRDILIFALLNYHIVFRHCKQLLYNIISKKSVCSSSPPDKGVMLSGHLFSFFYQNIC